jgi:polyhydroxyalkanoate synthesis regulator phasin
MATDINSILKKYLAAMGKSEISASELTKDLRVWVVENGEVVKEKIENRIDETASRMGFVKSSDLDNLLARISDLESRLPESKTKVTKSIKKSGFSSPNKSAKESVKKSANKSAKKSVKKSVKKLGKKTDATTKKNTRERTKG